MTCFYFYLSYYEKQNPRFLKCNKYIEVFGILKYSCFNEVFVDTSVWCPRQAYLNPRRNMHRIKQESDMLNDYPSLSKRNTPNPSKEYHNSKTFQKATKCTLTMVRGLTICYFHIWPRLLKCERDFQNQSH